MEQFTTLIENGRRNGLLIDANLLLLLVIGYTDQRQISRFDRLSAYTQDDFDLLVNLVEQAPQLVTLPNVLTEVSNLAGKLKGDLLEAFFVVFGGHIEVVSEHSVPSRQAARESDFIRLGLTDSAIIIAALETKCTVVTADVRLYLALEECGASVINFNHLRQAVGIFDG